MDRSHNKALSGGLGGPWHELHAYGATASRVSGHAALSGGKRRASALATLHPLLSSAALKPQNLQLRDPIPSGAILKTTRDPRVAIVVMGVMSRSGLQGFLIGNTAARVIDELSFGALIAERGSFGILFSRHVRAANLLSVGPPRPPC